MKFGMRVLYFELKDILLKREIFNCSLGFCPIMRQANSSETMFMRLPF